MPKRLDISSAPKQSCEPAKWLWLAPCTVSLLLSISVHAQEAARCATSAASLDSLEGRVQWQGAGESQWRDARLHQTFCYGDTLLVQEKRAALRLSNNTLVRLNENSSLKLVPPEQSFWVELIDGAAHILTRTPKSFSVKAPYVNAAVEGTEFLVTAQSGLNRVGVIEGVVRSSNAAGSVLLTQGQSTQTGSSSEAPSAPIMLKLNDFVSWAMYFPPMPGRANLPADFKGHLEKGEDGLVIKHISDNNQSSAEMLSLGAALALNRGQLAQAEQLIQRALTLSAKHPDAQAIASLIELGQGQLEKGKQRAAQNVLDNPFNPTALIAHSYTQQAEGRLQAALDSALEAQRLTPNDSQITARVAELYLSLGQHKQAEETLDKALAQAPNHSRLLTFKGFSLLAKRKAKAAQAYFVKASDLNSADPYAQLGWGMALIQRGKLEQGREHLELAVILDPANSVLRSYLGKGYFEEDKLKLADTQLNLAKTLDPNDPTPWYYLSQVKHEEHKYGQALELIETSIDKNANRVVYRDGGAIDSDAAARIADKARIYQAMGASQQAIAAASDAIRTDPNDYAGHRAMAMALTGREGAQTARANEALQASLLAPVGATPLAPGFGEPAMQVLPGTGPHEMGINEYNSAFTSNGISGFVSALGAGNNTRATEAQAHLVGEKSDLSLGQYHYYSDGFKENNDRDYLVNEARLKSQVTDNVLTQITVSERHDDLGDISEAAVKEVLSTNLRSKSSRDAYSIGLVYSYSDTLHFAGLRSSKRERIDSHYENEFAPGFALRNDDSPFVKSDSVEVIGGIKALAGNFYVGFGSSNVETEENFSSEFVIDGLAQGDPDLISGRSREEVDKYYVDYFLSVGNFHGVVGVEQKKIKDYSSDSTEEFYRAEIGFGCLRVFDCAFTHYEFLSMPTPIREDLRLQVANVFVGRTDYLPFARVKVDSVNIGSKWANWNVLAAYQISDVEHPPEFDNAFNPILSPGFREKEYLVELLGSISRIDAIRFQYSNNSIVALYGNGAGIRAEVPHEASTQYFGFSVKENFYGVLELSADVKSLDQQYVYPLQLDLLDFPTRARFVNLDLGARYIVSDVILEVSILNALDNKKAFIDGSPANLGSDAVAKLDRFVAERVMALSAKINF